MENIPHGITIESYSADTQTEQRAAGENGVYSLHTWRDLHLIPVCQPIVQPPLEKTLTLDVEGMSGVADLSHGLTGYPIFQDREGSWQFWLDTDSYQEATGYYGPVGDRAYREIKAKLVSLMRSPYQTKIILDDEPGFYYIGRIWLDGKPSYQYDHAKFTLSYRLYPYKYMRNEYGGDWLWDTFRFTTDFADTRSSGSGMWNWDSFCFETDLATAKMKNVALKAGQTESFPLVFTDKPSAVFVTSSGKALAYLKNQNGGDYVEVRDDFNATWGSVTDALSTQLIYPFRTKKYPLHLTQFGTMLSFESGSNDTQNVTVSIKEKHSSILITNEVVSQKFAFANLYPMDLEYDLDLKANTSYEIVMSSNKKFSGTILHTGDSIEDTSDYITLERGRTIGTEDIDCVIFGGYLDYYAGYGAVLKDPEKKCIGAVGTGVADSESSVVVKAEEDTVVDIEYVPAYL